MEFFIKDINGSTGDFPTVRYCYSTSARQLMYFIFVYCVLQPNSVKTEDDPGTRKSFFKHWALGDYDHRRESGTQHFIPSWKKGEKIQNYIGKSKSIIKVKHKDVVGVFWNAESNPASVLSYFYYISGGIGHLSV